jgi:hypothetical protein
MNPYAFTVTEQSVFQKLLGLNSIKATGPDGIPCWLLKENADIFARSRPVMSIIRDYIKQEFNKPGNNCTTYGCGFERLAH